MSVKQQDVPSVLTVRVPLTIRKRGGRKLIVAPGGEQLDSPPPRSEIDSTLVKALARAFRWRKMLEDHTHNTLRDLAAAEKINESYLSRVLRLTLLAPNIIEAILEGRQSPKLSAFMEPFSLNWDDQAAEFTSGKCLRIA